MDVWDVDAYPWLIEEKRVIRRWVRELNRPFLGVYLGHQLLADALKEHLRPAAPPKSAKSRDIEHTDGRGREGSPQFAGAARPVQGAAMACSVRVAQPPEGARSARQLVALPRPGDAGGGPGLGPTWYPCRGGSRRGAQDWACVPEHRRALEETNGPGAMERLPGRHGHERARRFRGQCRRSSGAASRAWREVPGHSTPGRRRVRRVGEVAGEAKRLEASRRGARAIRRNPGKSMRRRRRSGRRRRPWCQRPRQGLAASRICRPGNPSSATRPRPPPGGYGRHSRTRGYPRAQSPRQPPLIRKAAGPSRISARGLPAIASARRSARMPEGPRCIRRPRAW